MAAEALQISHGHQKMIIEYLKASGGSCSYEVFVRDKIIGIYDKKSTRPFNYTKKKEFSSSRCRVYGLVHLNEAYKATYDCYMV